MKLLRFPEWSLDSQGHIHSDWSAEDEQDLGTENEFKCLRHPSEDAQQEVRCMGLQVNRASGL